MAAGGDACQISKQERHIRANSSNNKSNDNNDKRMSKWIKKKKIIKMNR